LFCQFDVKGNGLIDFDEFVTGLSLCARYETPLTLPYPVWMLSSRLPSLSLRRGTFDEKIHFIFNMYDTSHDNTVSKEELTTLLNHGNPSPPLLW
jgi:Ca2+-binding EF-hand superfamily protein